MEATSQSVGNYLAGVTPAIRRRDAETLVSLFATITGEEPTMWGTIVGFGSYHYRYASGREGDAPAAGFAARKASTTIYLADGTAAYTTQLERLGRHTSAVSCLYITDLEAVDLTVLEEIVTASFRTAANAGFGGHSSAG
jgi:hypothetical protein